MMNEYLNYLLVLIGLFVAQSVYFRIAKRFRIVDHPNSRSSHKHVTLLGGGVIFLIAAFFYLFFFSYGRPLFFIGLSLVAVISFYDDIKPQSQKIRLIIQSLAILLLFIELHLHWLPSVVLILSFIFATGILNAYNFMDGINGMTGLYNFVLFAFLLFIDQVIVDFFDHRFIVIIMLSLVVFNFYNFRRKAVCFAGDVGAFTIAYIVVMLLIVLMIKTQTIAYIALLAVYGVDSILTIVHRIYLKENIILPHRRHLFQILVNECRLPHLVVSSIYAGIQIIVNIGLFVFFEYSYIYVPSVILVLSVAYYLMKFKCSHLLIKRK